MALDTTDLTTETLCRYMLERQRGTIIVQKQDVALRKLNVIIAAALELSNSKGFQAMSLRDLSRETGLSMGGLYAYFDSKTTLLNMILMEVTEAVKRVLSDPPEEVRQDPAARLDWLIEAHIRMTELMQPWFTFAFMEAKNFPQAERRIAVESEALTESYFVAAIEDGIARGVFRPDVPALLPALIKPLLQEWYVKRAKYKRRDVSMEAYIATVQDIVRRICLPQADPIPHGR
ncbi:TetR/AcrR family transcriptional regulator [Maritimibacter alkaliphilus]|uniref:TetR/AcrR family transcriptional regulator n=1 Tax=Maritimibacter alkaliphilus TaxID=404236 RepID=UPI0021BD9869|nr:TetR/AcrR family transcriptional regulator [Maritimibacter alkaliphilus]